MTKVEISTLLALAAALLAGIGYVVLQRSAQQVTDEEVGHFTLFHLSLRHAQWWLGSAAALSSFTLQAVALTMGSVVLVQSLQATALLFALPIDARLTNHRCTPKEWMWAVLLASSVAVIVMAGDPAAGHARAPLSTWAVVAVVMVPAVFLCVLGARMIVGAPSAVLLAVASAATLAVFTVLTKGVVTVLGSGFAAVFDTPEFYAWIIVLPLGLMLQQSSLRAGALTASLPTIIVARPVIASALGISVLDETLHTGEFALFALVAAVAVVVAATIALARDEAAMMASPRRRIEATGQLAMR
ncbi:hypothetical protein MB901379_01803 [Mycobacterium basiliense]|uniref:Integral membrane protein n=1 Tax=Mycobacterium basiliense TaxID=2094119 RepID=A0A447GCM1_9MYCO|nr:DMT family transporter [Mycobacterium basiliense]VDM88247.1 hypothetical protein MB901379_01803 [Mycobacterium basiliense]